MLLGLGRLSLGQAPKKLRPFIGGASGFAFRKCSKPNADGVVEEDARPVCSGDVWRRVVGKALFRSEEDTFKEHLQPHQLAVSVKSGAEVMTHLARGWMEKYREEFSSWQSKNLINEADILKANVRKLLRLLERQL